MGKTTSIVNLTTNSALQQWQTMTKDRAEAAEDTTIAREDTEMKTTTTDAHSAAATKNLSPPESASNCSPSPKCLSSASRMKSTASPRPCATTSRTRSSR